MTGSGTFVISTSGCWDNEQEKAQSLDVKEVCDKACVFGTSRRDWPMIE